MAIEVRQMVIKSSVGGAEDPAAGPAALTGDQLVRVKAEILEECKAWFLEELRLRQER